MSRKPKFISPCVAERMTRQPDMRIAEFSIPTETGTVGGLICLSTVQGVPCVEIYRTEGEVLVVVPEKQPADPRV